MALAANTAGIARADNDENEHKYKKENLKKFTEQVKKVAELNKELFKQSSENEKENKNSYSPSVQPASVTINPHGEVKLTGAEVVSAVASTGTLTAKVWGITFTLALNSNSDIRARGGVINSAQIQVGDKLNIKGIANAATPLTIQVSRLEDMTLNVMGNGSNDEATRLRAQIQMLMDKLNALLARYGNPSATSTTPVVVLPTITSMTPTTTTVGSANFALTVNGTNFASSSIVYWSSTALATTFVSSTQITAVVPATNVLASGNTLVTVTNPGSTGGTSNAITFTIVPASTSTATSTAQ